jgi:hypothetical protein
MVVGAISMRVGASSIRCEEATRVGANLIIVSASLIVVGARPRRGVGAGSTHVGATAMRVDAYWIWKAFGPW